MITNCENSDQNDCNQTVDQLSAVSETNDNTNEDNASCGDTKDVMPSMSKKQMKRELRHKQWLDLRPEKRRQEKERKKLKLKRLREEGIELKRNLKRSELISMSSSKCQTTVCIDCHFEDYMNERDIKKLVKQIGRCYAVNRHSSAPVQLYITSITGKIKDMFTRCQSGYCNWDAVCDERHWTQVFADKSKVIYMTSDSEDLIPEPKDICLSNDLVFIIGGLVDHNQHKGLCHRLAVEQSVRTARLPIDECIQMSQRRVLAVNHVFEIMLSASNGSSNSWTHIFNEVIPMRKIVQ